jgi:hypothetical protein
MDENKSFGHIHSKEFNVGDIVEWSKWDSTLEKWECHYGILLTINNEIRSNRLVSISTVMPMNFPNDELEFFTMSLRLISHGENINT